MAEIRKEPKIRFKGFTDVWEQCKLGDTLADLYNGQTPSRFHKEYWNGDISWLSSGELNRGIVLDTVEKITESGKDSAHLRVVPKGTFVMSITGLEAAGTRGNCGILGLDTTMNQSCMALFPYKNILDTKFLFQWYRFVGEDYGIRFTQGTKQQSYNAEIIKDLDITMPKLEEQERISDFLFQLDNLITLHQSERVKITIIKKFMLEKMFPKDGSNVPEIRFGGFTGPWERHELNVYLDVSTEKNNANEYTKQDVLSVSGDFGVVNQIEFQGRSFAGVSVANYGVVHTGDVVYTKSPLSTNPFGIIKTNKGKAGIVSTLYAVYHPKENTYPDFVQYYFEQNARLNNYLLPLVNKGAKNDMKISAENALKGEVIFPKYEEQCRISGILTELDKLIALYQRRLEKLNNIKSSCLEKMFV